MNHTFKKTALAIAIATAWIGRVEAATISVNATCPLRDAIEAANTDSVVNNCIAGNGADEIILSGNVFLNVADEFNPLNGDNGLPSITSVISIVGDGSQRIERSLFAIVNLNKFRFFNVEPAGNLTLTNVTIRKGDVVGDGGAIKNRGTLSLQNVNLEQNQASAKGGAIAQFSGAMTLTNSTVSGNSVDIQNGGGILVYYSTATLNNSTVSGNSAQGKGGGIRARSGILTLNDSTISGNSAHGNGGGMASYDGHTILARSTVSGNTSDNQGGGFYAYGTGLNLTDTTLSGNTALRGAGIASSSGASITLSNSTVSNNTATANGGGIYGVSSYINLDNSTVTANSAVEGGGISTYNKLTLTNTTMILNESAVGAYSDALHIRNGTTTLKNSILGLSDVTACENNGGTLVLTGLNLIEGGGCGTAANPSVLKGDPMLGALADNGGLTLTHAPLSGSPVIDVGNDSICDAEPVNQKDQRGVARPQGSHCDLGSVEVEDNSFFIIPLLNGRRVIFSL